MLAKDIILNVAGQNQEDDARPITASLERQTLMKREVEIAQRKRELIDLTGVLGSGYMNHLITFRSSKACKLDDVF